MATSEQISINPQSLLLIQAVDEATLNAARAESARRQREEGSTRDTTLNILLKSGAVTPEHMFKAYAHEKGLTYYDEDEIKPTIEVRDHIPHELARELKVVPIGIFNGRLRVVVQNPTRNLRAAIENSVGYEIEYAIASQHSIATKVAEYYSSASEAAATTIHAASNVDDAPSLETLLNSSIAGADQAVAKNVMLLILHGIEQGASDIHLEPFNKIYRVRYRIDGDLRIATEISYQRDDARLIIARIKIMSGLKTEEQRLPQDGRISFNHNGRKVDLRIAVVPGKTGEKIVMRILANDLAGKSLDQLNFSTHNLKLLRDSLHKPHGIILVTGPTGSGKSTTLYAGIGEIATPEVNVMTVEDPVEYQVDGINQTQIHEAIGLTFAATLRSFLRADPDIILLGEIRDQETAEIATKAALTGHLVLSTLHTNSAAETVTRLVDMGIKPYTVADALNASLSQRLIRRLCVRCRVAYTPTIPEVEALSGTIPDIIPEVWKANPDGCRNCHRGYSGRVPVHELLPMTSHIKSAISKGATATEIAEMSIAEGKLRPIAVDGWEKITQGLTDIEQVLALLSSEE